MDSLGTSWKSSFFKDNFSVDHCLAECTQKSDLETLRRELKSYGTELQLQMSEILKNETEAIVNLAEYLTSLNSKIENLSSPISQLKEEIKYDLVISTECSYKALLEDTKINNSKQNQVHLKLGIISCCLYINSIMDSLEKNEELSTNLLTLERVVNKYSFQKTYLNELNLMTSDIDGIVKNVELRLVKSVDRCFLKAVEVSDKDMLKHCLRMYVNLQKEDEAHNTFRINIIKPALQPLFTERYLEKHSYDLDFIYSQLRTILDDKVNLLSSVISENNDLASFNFVLKSFWKEFDTQSREKMPLITAPGNPELFQKRFTSTYNFLKFIAKKGGDEKLVIKDPSFQDHLKRFNLPVYFEIIFQQIAGRFESDICRLSINDISSEENEHGFTLKPSVFFWKALVACFHKDIYIDQLADNFLRLFMMIVARYIKVLESIIEDILASGFAKDKIDEIIVDGLIDLNIAKTKIFPPSINLADIKNTVFSVVNQNMWPILIKVFKANQKTVDCIQENLKLHLQNSKISQCIVQLQNVTAIPRLYRRTNRNPPRDASAYMAAAIKPIESFYAKFKPKLEKEVDDIVGSIIIKITNQYFSLVQEVLVSVCKTEESLRRLKSRTLNTSSDDSPQGTTDTTSDEAKIREQIKYDVCYFYDKLYALGTAESKHTMELLKKEVGK